jgi:Sulfotransferase family
MRNCIILGSGRSGTSLAAGLLAKAGYYMGENMVPARDANPKGFFEAGEINQINEDILAEVLPRRWPLIDQVLGRKHLGWMQRWLAQVPVGTEFRRSEAIQLEIQVVLSRSPFCLKDPRFCYTLPVWRPYLKSTVFVCIFRDPVTTANSILKETKISYMRGVDIDFQYAIRVWELMYQHVLVTHATCGNWLFIHYDQLMREDGVALLADFTETTVDRTFPDSSLKRSRRHHAISDQTADIYTELCQRAKYKDAKLALDEVGESNPCIS